MKKSKILLCLLLVATVLWMCRQDIDDTATEENIKELTVKTARQWYDQTQPGIIQYGQPSSSVLKSSGSVSRIINVPLWNKAKVRHKNHISWVEMNIASNCHQSYGPRPKGMVNSLSRLVVHRNLKTGKTKSFVMTIVADSAFMLRPDLGKRLSRVNLFAVDKEFSGKVLFSTLKGRLIVGYRYREGKRVSSLHRKNGKKSIPAGQTKGWVEDCYVVYEEMYGMVCAEVENDEIWEFFCDEEFIGYDEYIECDYIWEDEDDPCYYGYGDDCECYGINCGGDDPCDSYTKSYDPCECDGDCDDGTDIDCAGVDGGSAYTDACGDCVGGTTGTQPCDPNINHSMVQNNNLTNIQLDLLNKSIMALMQECFFSAMSSSFSTNGYASFSDIMVDPTYLGAAGVNNSYVLKFGWEEELSRTSTVAEEFFHLYQRRKYNLGNGGSPARPVDGYIEFEAKLMADIQAYNQGKRWADGNTHKWALKDGGDQEKLDYFAWLNNLTTNGTKWPTQINFGTYDDWAKLFAATNKQYKDLGLKFDYALPPGALVDIVNQSNCSH